MRTVFVTAIALLCVTLVPGAASASAASPFAAVDAAQGFLPKNAVPTFYRIDVAPNAKTGKIAGNERITLLLQKPAASIVLNATQTTFGRVTLDGKPVRAIVDPAVEQVTFRFAKAAAGKHLLDVAYTATLQKTAQGLFKQDYNDASGKPAYMYGTQLEATDARRMFPSFDEPAFKARFALSAVIPKQWTAVSNTPVVWTKPVGTAFKRVAFAPTPVMSTYLVVLTAGDFDQIHAMSDGIRLGVYATAGKKAQMYYALHVMEQLMPYYDRYYGVKFPIAKLDSIAIPGGFLGAMENWGGITYNEQTILFDPKKDSETDKKRIFGIIAHEESHQWNGDLTTEPWWDELWLAEGFATWMQTKAPNHFHPDWHVWLDADRAVDGALGSDALPSTHAVYEPVHNNTEIAAVFDEISYTKAGSVLRMLETYLGPTTFHGALQHYFRTHQYGSASAADLWKDLSTASGKNVAAIAHHWIYEPGFPLVTVSATCSNGSRRLELSQQRYFFDTAVNPGSTTWEIPLNLEADGRTGKAQPVLLRGKTQAVDGGSCDAPLVVNGDDVGFYRVAYDASLQAEQRAHFVALSPADRLSLLDDSWAFAQSGRANVGDYLGYVDADAKDTDAHVIGTILANFGSMLDYEKNKPGEAAFKTYLAGRLRPIVAAFGGWAGTGANDDQLEVRNTALRMLAECGDQPTIDEAKARFARFVKDPAAFSPLERDAVLGVVGYAADPAIYAQLAQLGMRSTDPTDQQRYFFAMFAAKDKALASQSLAMTLRLPPQFAAYAPFIVGAVGTQHPRMAWQFLNKNVRALFAGVTSFERPIYFSYAAQNFWQGIPADEIEAFLKANLPANARKEVAKAMLAVRSNQQLAARLVPEIDARVAAAGKATL